MTAPAAARIAVRVERAVAVVSGRAGRVALGLLPGLGFPAAQVTALTNDCTLTLHLLLTSVGEMADSPCHGLHGSARAMGKNPVGPHCPELAPHRTLMAATQRHRFQRAFRHLERLKCARVDAALATWDQGPDRLCSLTSDPSLIDALFMIG